MEKELKVGKGELEFEVKDGKVGVLIGYDAGSAEAGAFVRVDADHFVDLLEDLIPGDADKLLLEPLRAALK